MGQNKNFQFLHTAIIIVTLITAIAIFGWVFLLLKTQKKTCQFLSFDTLKNYGTYRKRLSNPAV